MKLTVERDRFADAINSAMRTAGKANTIPILNNVLLKPNGSKVAIAGTNLTTWFETDVPAEISGDGDPAGITIVSEALSGIINRMQKGAQLTLEWDDPMKGAQLKSGKSLYRLNTLPAMDFPALSHPESSTTFNVSAEQIRGAFGATKFAICKDVSRYYLCGAYMHVVDDTHPMFGGSKDRRLVFATCCGTELARATIPLPDGAANIEAVILPDIAIPEIGRLIADADEVSVSVTKTLVSFSVDGSTFTTKLVDGTYPAYDKVFPDSENAHLVADVQVLSEALSRITSIEGPSQTSCEMEAGQLRMRHINHQIGEADELVEIDWSGDKFQIAIAAGRLLAVLNAIESDQCIIKFTGSQGPMIINPWRNGAEDFTRTYASMPIEIRSPVAR